MSASIPERAALQGGGGLVSSRLIPAFLEQYLACARHGELGRAFSVHAGGLHAGGLCAGQKILPVRHGNKLMLVPSIRSIEQPRQVWEKRQGDGGGSSQPGTWVLTCEVEHGGFRKERMRRGFPRRVWGWKSGSLVLEAGKAEAAGSRLRSPEGKCPAGKCLASKIGRAHV